jgi:hypothetical protein
MAIGVNASISSGDVASTGGATSVTKPAGTANTDVLILVFGVDALSATPGTVTAPAGWTAINTTFLVTNGTSNVRLAAFWALGSVANLSFTNSATGQQQGWVCVGFTGVDNATPIDAVAATNSSSSATTLVTNAVTVATANAWHCIPAADWNGSAADLSAPSFTRQQNASANANATLLYNTTPKSAGSTGTVTVTSVNSATGQVILAMPFALRPDTGGGGGTGAATGWASTGVGIQRPVARGWL